MKIDLDSWRDSAIGPCIVCGKESKGSMYWTPLSDEAWAAVRPYVESLTPVSPHSKVKLVLNNLFWPQLSKPYCGPICSNAIP
jgi:hypothetical protein